jgi:hypothetical protein
MKYKITLTASDRQLLDQLIHSGSQSVRVITRARVLLLSDCSQGARRSNNQIMDALQTSETLILQTRRRYNEEGLSAALYERPRPGAAPRLTGEIEAQITMLACSTPPDGHTRWTVRLLTDKIIELGLIDKISHVAVHEKLKKMNLNLGESKAGA